MKKINLLIMMIIFLMFSDSGISSTIIEGRQYIKLNKPIHNAPKLLEFFSFYCAHCYQFDQIYHISDNIKNKLPENVNFCKYHVNCLGDLGKQLTHAWAVAIVLGVENQVSSTLFMAVQKHRSIHTVEDIRKIFIQSGVDSKRYDTAWNSSPVKSLIEDQEQAAINFQLQAVPSIFINGKYMVKNDKLDVSSVNAYIQQFSELLDLLMDKV